MELEYIKKYVETYLNIQDIGVRNREDRYKLARWAYYKICRRYTTESLNMIGRKVGGLTHASVINSLRAYSDTDKSEDMQVYINCVNLFSDSIEQNLEIFADQLAKPTTGLGKYIADLKKKAILTAAQTREKITSDIPWIEEYNALGGEAQMKFDVMAKAKIKMLKVVHEIK